MGQRDQVAGCWERSRPPDEPVVHIAVDDTLDLQRQAEAEQQPAPGWRGGGWPPPTCEATRGTAPCIW